jgi:hypothetical protein
VTI